MSENPFERYVNTLDVQWPSVEDATADYAAALMQFAFAVRAWVVEYKTALEALQRELESLDNSDGD